MTMRNMAAVFPQCSNQSQKTRSFQSTNYRAVGTVFTNELCSPLAPQTWYLKQSVTWVLCQSYICALSAFLAELLETDQSPWAEGRAGGDTAGEKRDSASLVNTFRPGPCTLWCPSTHHPTAPHPPNYLQASIMLVFI